MGQAGIEEARVRRARIRFIMMAITGVVVAAAVAAAGFVEICVVAGWAAACIVYLTWVWVNIGHLDAHQTQTHASRENPTRTTSDVLLLLASVASLVVVVLVLVLSTASPGVERDVLSGTAILSVVLSWFLIHTLYTLRYAVLYYSGTPGGVSFNQDEPPRFADFAYLAFTLGMTFQVSDTNISSSAIRGTVLRHSLLSYLFGAVILATLVNLVSGF
ncbi:DUF1345 domain-containing protein [Herbiconiux sp. CPCC 205716]|uniref:DUF1345 domain-containing protein n=1 Tax=Herbiconiux gentiana TaxID=2970912 RepID=A0ABT2GDE7_9MICO|nr:DUF1345 domain-containing protein [Herbiconiux gentiana]MCS5714222.1 DUF1345 domain-containing protein [Herbiconiux gentiana]